jgi:hypothetical protein
MAIGCGSLWSDKQMSEHVPGEGSNAAWMVEPDAKVKARYDVLFALLRSFLEDKPLPSPPPAKKPVDDAALKEAGPAEL